MAVNKLHIMTNVPNNQRAMNAFIIQWRCENLDFFKKWENCKTRNMFLKLESDNMRHLSRLKWRWWVSLLLWHCPAGSDIQWLYLPYSISQTLPINHIVLQWNVRVHLVRAHSKSGRTMEMPVILLFFS